jgi:Na+-transporting methylmalonyl-CoA/oxaloacetate decarboxylase gamma subunit
MTLLAVTSMTWFVTGLGFGLVLLLLFVFVYIMKFLGWIMQPRVKAAKQEEEHHEAVVHTEEKEDLTLTANATAAIAMALHLYYNSLHDEEPTKVTVLPHRTQWNNKMYGMNNLHR